MADEHLTAQARANPIENFRLVFNDAFIKSIVGRMDDNEDIFDDPRRAGSSVIRFLRVGPCALPPMRAAQSALPVPNWRSPASPRPGMM